MSTAGDPRNPKPEPVADVGDAPPDPVAEKRDNAGLRLAIELAPLAVWLVVFKFAGIILATEVLIAATLVALVAAHFLLGKISPMLIVTAVLVVVFGGLTVGFNEPRFIKIKPTVVNLLFAGALGYGLYSGRNFLKMMLGEAIHLTATGWRQLTYRWICLFIVQALLNEVIWRATDTHDLEYIWGYYKFPGMFVLTLVFSLINIPFMRRHTSAASSS